MNHLTTIQKEIIPANLLASSIKNGLPKQDMQIELLQTALPFFTDKIGQQQFSQKLPTAHLLPLYQQPLKPTLVATELTINTAKDANNLWLTEVAAHVAASLTEFEFTLDKLSRLIYLSPRQIRRRLKRLTGKTFSQYLKEARLQVAYQLLVQQEVKTIKKLAYQVGLRDVKHFSKQFKQYFGDSPSTFLA